MTASTAPDQSYTADPKPGINWEKRRQQVLNRGIVTMIAIAILVVWLMPFVYGLSTSLKTKEQITDPTGPILPATAVRFEYEGESYEVFEVPLESGVRDLALVNRGRESSEFLDPANPEAGLITWDGRWRTLAPTREVSPTWSNYPDAWTFIDFGRMLGWTLMYSVVTMIGAVASAALVAYGFSRFEFPYKNLLFIILLSTIILPPQVTTVPTYAFWVWLGLVPSWWPLIIPTFFGNAYNIFFLRQFFMTIPPEMEEAAKIDGAGPFRTFWSVILPQARPALVAISLFHFFFAWNDFFNPFIYTAGAREIVPITVGLTFFQGVFSSEPQLIQAAAILTLVIPMIIFFSAQKYFVQGIVITGNK